MCGSNTHYHNSGQSVFILTIGLDIEKRECTIHGCMNIEKKNKLIRFCGVDVLEICYFIYMYQKLNPITVADTTHVRAE